MLNLSKTKIIFIIIFYIVGIGALQFIQKYQFDKKQEKLNEFIVKFDNDNYCLNHIYYSDFDSVPHKLCGYRGLMLETQEHLSKMIDDEHQEEFNQIIEKFTNLVLHKPVKGDHRVLEPNDMSDRLDQMHKIYGNLYTDYLGEFDFFNASKEEVLQKIDENSENIIYYLQKQYEFIEYNGFSTETYRT